MLATIATALTVFVIVEHIYIFWMEMFAWESAGKRVFGKTLPLEIFKPTKDLAANQGLYNGFLVAGLVWSFLIDDAIWGFNIRLFFLSCVGIAGIFVGLSASKNIFFVQGIPALLAILFLIISK